MTIAGEVRGQSLASGRRNNLFASLSLVMIFGWFIFESIGSKTSGAATSSVAAGVLFLMPMLAPNSFFNTAHILRSLRDVLPLFVLMSLYVFLAPLSVVPDNDSDWVGTCIYIGMLAFAYLGGATLGRIKLSPSTLIVMLAPVLMTSVLWVYQFNEGTAVGFSTFKNVVIGLIAHIIFALCFAVRGERRFLVVCFAIFVIAMLTSQRSFIPSIIVCAGVYMILKRQRLRMLHRVALVAALITVGFFLFHFVSQLNYNPSFYEINKFSLEWTGRRLNSGREELWHELSYYLSQSPWVGLGTGVIPSTIMNTPLSSHNSFLQLALQAGLLGVSVIAWQIWRLLGRYSKTEDRDLSAAAAAYVTFVVFHAFTETFLTTNSFIIAATVWLTFGLLVGRCRPVRVRRQPDGHLNGLTMGYPSRPIGR